ncbi:DUF1638 domain-containing protein [Oceanicola sp. 502str15]|uniref:DUF1638 domain-containing protein n=1 Tax=Oceanicola sp. 502str15 TaxID=2696061 RepID=UPI0020958EA9|nr:DUF1638 domain-containing protein [Oceanicola sp. 502str15]MCO6382330.1 DUF1638 domain-containing protein [Oceanicola sp. 502str15]
MKLPSDSKLTEAGLAPEGRGELLLIACGALAREILALIEQNGWSHMALTCLPAILHNRPEGIPDAVEAVVHKHRDAFERIYVVYADCGTGGLLEARCKDLGVEMVPGPHCYSFFEGNADFAAHDDEITAFYLTDFLVRQFDAFVTKPLKFDKHPELKEMYFGHYEKLVYQAQTDDPALTELAKTHAETLGLTFERRFTGYGDLETALAGA